MFTDNEIQKLPKWAQSNIKTLMANVEYYKKKSEEIAGESETNTFIDSYPTKLPLPSNSRIAFKFEKGEIICYSKNDSLELHANYGGNSEFVIKPDISNGVKAKII